MQVLDETVVVCGLCKGRQKALDKIIDALLATCHLEQLGVQCDIPVPRQMIFREGLVEGDAVRVLGIGQCAVHVKYDGFDGHGILENIVGFFSKYKSAIRPRQYPHRSIRPKRERYSLKIKIGSRK